MTQVPSAMARAAAWVGQLQGLKRAAFAVLLGAASVLAFAPVHAWPVLFVTFGGLVWLLDGCHARGSELRIRLRCAGLTGFWFGFGYFLAGFYWMAEAFLVEPWRHGWLIPFVMTAMPAGMALFFAAAGALAMVMWRPGAGRVFALAIALGLAEYARGHVLTGLPWNLIGYGLLPEGPLMQLAALLGVYALSIVAVLLFAAPAAILSAGQAPSKGAAALAAFLLVALGLGFVWGDRRLAAAADIATDVRLRIVQANIDQANKWRPEWSTDGNHITFKYKDSETGELKTRRVRGEDFLVLVLQHTLPKGFRRARDYGFLHGNAKRILTLVQWILKINIMPLPRKARPAFICHRCQGTMAVIGFSRPNRPSG